ncbi:MarR family winged helix-turn-helix transcriptional regulator [Pseudodesulfovibrio portus]|uniref:HTH marR-type domain-containing protein n=1 Tax=Pseudodesulfovibrio portus TaxID=231439 RepID=A0ABM8API4_9BACT|nr:MarR family winged helix-turn-helix transcriptional regulator [Pseudodesulfovibrio portus]BDQ33295.1 hypothetical protein JCM14722_08370 [Pseudodesulfovibrio portus]
MKITPEMQRLFSSLGFVLEKYVRVSKSPLTVAPDETLFPAEIHAVSWVAKNGPVGVTELGDAFGTTKGASSQMVGKLAERGFVQKEPDPEKRSRMLVTVTEKGRMAHERHMEFHMDHDRDFLQYLAALDTERFGVIEGFCRQMHVWMDSYLE